MITIEVKVGDNKLSILTSQPQKKILLKKVHNMKWKLNNSHLLKYQNYDTPKSSISRYIICQSMGQLGYLTSSILWEKRLSVFEASSTWMNTNKLVMDFSYSGLMTRKSCCVGHQQTEGRGSTLQVSKWGKIQLRSQEVK